MEHPCGWSVRAWEVTGSGGILGCRSLSWEGQEGQRGQQDPALSGQVTFLQGWGARGPTLSRRPYLPRAGGGGEDRATPRGRPGFQVGTGLRLKPRLAGWLVHWWGQEEGPGGGEEGALGGEEEGGPRCEQRVGGKKGGPGQEHRPRGPGAHPAARSVRPRSGIHAQVHGAQTSGSLRTTGPAPSPEPVGSPQHGRGPGQPRRTSGVSRGTGVRRACSQRHRPGSRPDGDSACALGGRWFRLGWRAQAGPAGPGGGSREAFQLPGEVGPRGGVPARKQARTRWGVNCSAQEFTGHPGRLPGGGDRAQAPTCGSKVSGRGGRWAS